MDSNSWMRLAAQDPQHQLPAALRAQDPRGAVDCGWVEQMTPFITQFARPGEWVIDPFCGFGSTLVAAAIAGVPALGLDLDSPRVALSRARLDGMGVDAQKYPVWQGNLAEPATQARCLEARFGLCLTNIPYFACDPGDQSRPDQLYQSRHYEPYLQSLREVFNGVHAVLAPGAWCIVMAQNLRLGASFVPLAWDVAKLLDERFVLHEERVLIYERASEAARLGAGGLSATNRAHEYALVCRKQSRGVDVDAGVTLLRALEQDGFEFLLYGSFADHLQTLASAPEQALGMHEPNDIDIICPPADAELSRLMRRLEHEGFRIESWNAQVRAPVAAALAYRYYLRARRMDAFGNRLQLDIAVAESRAVFDDQRTKRCSTTSLPHWLPGCSSSSLNPASS